MFKKAMGKLKSVTQKNLNRFHARQAIKKGMFKGIDRKAMLDLREKFSDHAFRKYEHKFDHSLVRNAERVFALGLDKTPPLSILDLGCGFGYFLYGARFFGHRVVGLDVNDPYMLAITQLFGLTKVLHTIRAFQPLPDIPGGPFDRITAFATMFDNAGLDGQWGRKEWTFFLRDLRRFMAPTCVLHIKFNQYVGPGTKSGIGCRTVTDDLWKFFLEMGGEFDKRFLRIADAPSQVGKLPVL
ncbi:MAG TPA: class I SAM-dependent methyltransferase [Planctomycetota bacterium]|nr:class I SAM-dependent methyltransferase [Planctomycetota bacterium]